MSIPFFFIVIAAFASHFHLASALPLVVGRDDTNSSGNLGSAVSGSGTSHIVEAAIIAFLGMFCALTFSLSSHDVQIQYYLFSALLLSISSAVGQFFPSTLDGCSAAALRHPLFHTVIDMLTFLQLVIFPYHISLAL